MADNRFIPITMGSAQVSHATFACFLYARLYDQQPLNMLAHNHVFAYSYSADKSQSGLPEEKAGSMARIGSQPRSQGMVFVFTFSRPKLEL